MQNKNLEKSKRKLTLSFTVIITLITVFVGIISLSGKFINEYRKDHLSFDLISKKIENSSKKGVIQLFDIVEKDSRIFNSRKELVKNKLNNLFPGNVLILKGNELINHKFIEKIDSDNLEKIINYSNYEKSIIEGIINIKFSQGPYSIYVFKKLKYNLSDYFFDLFSYIFIVLLLSIGFYYIGLKFVTKVLTPVEENMKDMSDFIHNAGHELKTPISIISSNLQLIKETKKYDKELIKEGLIEINRLNHLIESLVELSNISENIESDKLNLEEEIKLIIKDFKVEADIKRLNIKFFNKTNRFLTINKQYFYILFSNIFKNAIKYTSKEGKIEIILERNYISVKDNGSGIKKEDLQKIWDRFYIGTTARQSDSHGIGLSLVKKISDIYGFKLEVKSEVGKGSEFKIIF